MKKILIADDESSLRMLVNATLEGEKFQILQAKNGHEAVLTAQLEKPDLIIMDWMMAGLSGIEALEILRKTASTTATPIIILTAKNQSADKEKAFGLGANYFLAKPFSPLELLNLVDRILREN
ncbi:MAG: response regulator [Nitrospirae bacterium]|nr:response regulator [Nitrospirota bacterium]MBI3353139.1 response regulator [Nitrospirota bacterium]